MNKPQLLFFMNRTLKDLEGVVNFDHKAAAQRGMPYSERKVLMDQGQLKAPEAEAMRLAIQLVEGHYPDGEKKIPLSGT
jgi:hypothetical protein